MAGTYVRDALGVDLVTGVTLNSAGTTSGNVQDLQYPGHFGVELVTSTVTGTSPTLNVEITASNSSTFASGNVSLGRFAQVTASSTTRQMQFYTNKRYVRATAVVGGTTPVFTGTTLKVVPAFDRFSATSTA